MREHFPNEVKWNTPLGGMFVWAELPPWVDTTELLIKAMEKERVAFTPGAAFRVSDKRYASHCMRLNFSNSTPQQIEDGIFRLSRALKAAMA
jgi:2-aminoadipate transaminase